MPTESPIVLSIAGSDPSGGAGIQADLKTATALGVYGAAVLTSLTVQNTRQVSGIHPVPAEFVADQCEAVLDDLDVRAIKIGMLATPEIAAAVADVLARRRGPAVVLDPVMVATSGGRLLTAESTAVLRDRLLPLATVITPNLPETGALLDAEAPASIEEMITAAGLLQELGTDGVLVKGGHLPDDHDQAESADLTRSSDRRSVDVLAHRGTVITVDGPYVPTPNTHGTGCTLSTAIASRLALGDDLPAAARAAKDYVTGALRSGAGLAIGSGSGPVDHLWER